MQLSAQQKDAVEYIGSPALVIAGAGSGKTRTLTAKIAYLVSNGYDPLRILAITFTNKAAGEMKSRLVQLTNMPAADFPWVRTYHSACFRILKRYGYLLGFTPPIQIFTEYQRNKLLKDIILKLNIDKKTLPSISSQISYAKNSGDPHAYFEQKSGFSPVRYSDIYALYEKELFEKNAVDFDNILFLTRNLLKDHDALRKEYQNFFQFILVDEYQDSNNLQEELTRLFLGHENLFCVGDDWQAIYGFRGSNVNHFLTFAKKYEGARIFRLEENYRSSDEIVQVANSLIDYNEQKMDKKCFSRKKGGIVELYDFFNDNEESRWVANKIMGFREQGIPLHKMVVLYRTKFCSLAFEKTFRAFNVPYRMMGSKGFFERKEVLDINCYLIAAAFPKDDAAFERIINTPKRGIGPGMLNKINAMREEEMSLQDAARKALSEKVFTPKVYNALSELIQLLDDIKEQPPEAAIQEILTRSNYPEYLKHYSKTDAEYTSREEHIEELAYSASQKQTIHEYLEEVSLVREDKEEDETDNTIGIGLSTVHASKGLEYQVVFIVGCEENLFPHWRSLESQAELQEERRLMYVAVTRSEQFLFISSTNFRRGQPALRSRFLDEIEESI